MSTADLTKTRLKNFLRLLFVFIWALLFGALLNRDYFITTLDLKETQLINRSREESFQGIYFQNERIGYVRNRLTPVPEEKGFTMQQEAFLKLNILHETHPVSMEMTASLARDLLLKEFTFKLSSPFYRMSANGTVDNQRVTLTMQTGKATIRDVIRLNRPPFLATNQRDYLLTDTLTKGDKVKIPYFDPISLAGKDTVIEYRGKEKILINGRIHHLHHFVESFSGLRINNWLNDQGRVIKEESPTGFVFLAEPEFKATAIGTPSREILSSVAVPLSGPMPSLASSSQITYRLTLPTDHPEFALNNGRQNFRDDLLTITGEALPPHDATACQAPGPNLATTPYVQSQHQLIRDRARAITDQAPRPWDKVISLASWVHDNLEKRPVLGIPDAMTVLQTRRGDCNEHAALFAALARSLKIPTKIVAGVTLHQGAFYYHAWNEVCLNNGWISLDTTKDQLPADLSHIKFVEGETEEMVKIGALLGKLAIEVVD